MQDKRNRFFLCTALHDSPIPFEKALSLRLGLKKGELRMADADSMQASLLVGPGAATPIAACQPSATRVVALLDERLRDGPFLIHPLDNTQSVLVTSADIEAFFVAHGKKAHFVDLSKTDFVIGKDSPPDLKEVAATVAEEKSLGVSTGVAAGTDSQKEKKAARYFPASLPLRHITHGSHTGTRASACADRIAAHFALFNAGVASALQAGGAKGRHWCRGGSHADTSSGLSQRLCASHPPTRAPSLVLMCPAATT